MAAATEPANGSSVPSSGSDDLNQKIKDKGDQVRELKTAKADKVKENSFLSRINLTKEKVKKKKLLKIRCLFDAEY